MDERNLAVLTLVAVLLIYPQAYHLPAAPTAVDRLGAPARHHSICVAKLRRLEADRSALDLIARELSLSAPVLALP